MERNASHETAPLNQSPHYGNFIDTTFSLMESDIPLADNYLDSDLRSIALLYGLPADETIELFHGQISPGGALYEFLNETGLTIGKNATTGSIHLENGQNTTYDPTAVEDALESILADAATTMTVEAFSNMFLGLPASEIVHVYYPDAKPGAVFKARDPKLQDDQPEDTTPLTHSQPEHTNESLAQPIPQQAQDTLPPFSVVKDMSEQELDVFRKIAEKKSLSQFSLLCDWPARFLVDNFYRGKTVRGVYKARKAYEQGKLHQNQQATEISEEEMTRLKELAKSVSMSEMTIQTGLPAKFLRDTFYPDKSVGTIYSARSAQRQRLKVEKNTAEGEDTDSSATRRIRRPTIRIWQYMKDHPDTDRQTLRGEFPDAPKTTVDNIWKQSQPHELISYEDLSTKHKRVIDGLRAGESINAIADATGLKVGSISGYKTQYRHLLTQPDTPIPSHPKEDKTPDMPVQDTPSTPEDISSPDESANQQANDKTIQSAQNSPKDTSDAHTVPSTLTNGSKRYATLLDHRGFSQAQLPPTKPSSGFDLGEVRTFHVSYESERTREIRHVVRSFVATHEDMRVRDVALALNLSLAEVQQAIAEIPDISALSPTAENGKSSSHTPPSRRNALTTSHSENNGTDTITDLLIDRFNNVIRSRDE